MGQIKELPTPEVLSWYLSGSSGGKDKKGVAVRLDLENGVLTPDRNFTRRLQEFQSTDKDPFIISEMPDLNTLNAYFEKRGTFNIENGCFEINERSS